MPPLCRVDLQNAGDVCIAALVGELDLSNVGEIESQLSGLLQTPLLVVDLAELAYVDSSGLGMLDRLARRTDLRLVGPDDAVIARTLRITGIDQVVPVFTSRAAALAGTQPR